jgi:hypothetical protein
MELRPTSGGIFRPFGAAWFIIEFLKGHGPEDAPKIDPIIGSTMTDIHSQYKMALHRFSARDAVKKEEWKRLRLGLSDYSEQEYKNRLVFYMSRIPRKLSKMKYASFTRYCGTMQRLGWIEKTGITEPSEIQDDHPGASPRVYYRISQKGLKVTAKELADPVQALYHYPREKRSAKRHSYYTHYTQASVNTSDSPPITSILPLQTNEFNSLSISRS